MPLTDEIWARAAAAPGRPAVRGVDVLSYGALTAAADRLAGVAAARLARVATCHRPPRVALLSADNRDFVVPFLAMVRAGAVVCPIDRQLPAAERTNLLAELAPALILGAVDDPMPVSPVTGEGGGVPGEAAPDDGAPFLITFTAGSTGRPKGVERSHASWLASLAVARHEFRLDRDETVLVPGPLVHSLFLFALVEALTAGATVRLLPRFVAEEAVAQLATGAVTRVVGVPTMFAAIVATAGAVRLPAVQTLMSAGAKLAPPLAAALRRLCPAARLIEYYGASELSFVSLADSGEGCPADAVGRPIAGVEVAIRDAEGGAVAPGGIGTLWVKSPMLASGLVVGAGAFRRDADGWATVGDLAWQDGAGWLHLAGRADGMLISGGRNIYPAGVERALAACPAVADAVVLGIPDPYWGERLVAVVRWQPGEALSLDRLISHCRTHLARHALPKQVFVTDAIPLTATGKPARARLRQDILAGAPTLRPLERMSRQA